MLDPPLSAIVAAKKIIHCVVIHLFSTAVPSKTPNSMSCSPSLSINVAPTHLIQCVALHRFFMSVALYISLLAHAETVCPSYRFPRRSSGLEIRTTVDCLLESVEAADRPRTFQRVFEGWI